jgi:hypothetical protein
MSDRAKLLLRQAVQAYEDDDGASKLGSYRDAMTDLLHFVDEDETVKKLNPGYPVRDLADEAYGSFMEELEQAEYDKMMKIIPKDLPLHLHDKWEFDTVNQEFWKRMEGADTCSSKDTSTASSSAS